MDISLHTLSLSFRHGLDLSYIIYSPVLRVIYLTEEQQHLALYLAQRLPEIEQGGRSGRIVYRELVAPEAVRMTSTTSSPNSCLSPLI